MIHKGRIFILHELTGVVCLAEKGLFVKFNLTSFQSNSGRKAPHELEEVEVVFNDADEPIYVRGK